ncbi:MAG TPA: hypothetical protein VED87_02400 [Methylocystis sp.]|nr:hypothetical protein [Methylocystis sp.]
MSLHQRLLEPIRLTPNAPILFLGQGGLHASPGILGMPRPGVRSAARQNATRPVAPQKNDSAILRRPA